MDLFFSQSFKITPRDIIRKAGYAEFRDPNTKKISYVRRLTNTGFFPRFHVYIEFVGKQLKVNVHLDQKHASYHGNNMHSGEYDTPVVKEEAARVERWFLHFAD